MRRTHVLVCAVLGALTMAPTVGDVGGCGKDVTELDRQQFADARKLEDCERCTECSIGTDRCQRACDKTKPSDVVLPQTCRPLFHDGEVCLRKLASVSCDTYATYVDDFAASVPSECEFCRTLPAPTTTTPPSFADGGSP